MHRSSTSLLLTAAMLGIPADLSIPVGLIPTTASSSRRFNQRQRRRSLRRVRSGLNPRRL